MQFKLRSIFLLLILSVSISAFAQDWDKVQLENANTAKNIASLSKDEKEAIQYINLCRLYPAEFAKKVVSRYQADVLLDKAYIKEFAKYRQSLYSSLLTRKPCEALQFDETLYRDAKCFSGELSKTNRTGHERKTCKSSGYSECLSFGESAGKDIALQLLIDTKVKSLGHRMICLDSDYGQIGISTNTHAGYGVCAVLEFL